MIIVHNNVYMRFFCELDAVLPCIASPIPLQGDTSTAFVYEYCQHCNAPTMVQNMITTEHKITHQSPICMHSSNQTVEDFFETLQF